MGKKRTSNVGGRTRVTYDDPSDVEANNGASTDYNKLFSSGIGGGLWVNNDITDVNSIYPIIPGLTENLNLSAYAIDPNDSMTFYIGTSEQYTAGAAVENGLYKTIDRGSSCTEVPVTPAVPRNLNAPSDLFTAGIFFITDIIVWDNNGTSEVFVGVGFTI
ncbi:MAG: hypothetical protein ACJAT0_002601 [Nonlabens sp.]|jgi:hypothetical protein|uniref:hypothetical protein n=1 Tax=Nonlabens sp. TaxID=1888209 RepID=UPI0039E36CD1